MRDFIPLVVFCFTFLWTSDSHSSTEAKVSHPTMNVALEFFYGLTDNEPLTQSKIEAIARVTLATPDVDYPSHVLKFLEERGIPRPLKQTHVEGIMPINEDLILYIRHKYPYASITFGVTPEKRTPLPSPLTNEALERYGKELRADYESKMAKHCIDRDKIVQLLSDNGWSFIKDDLTSDLTEDDGNFLFTRNGVFTMATLDDGCLVQLKVDRPR